MLAMLLVISCALCGWFWPACSDFGTRNTFIVPLSEQHQEYIVPRHILTFADAPSNLQRVGAGHSEGHKDCPTCNAMGHLAMDPRGFGNLTFSQAFPIWLASRVRISEASRNDYKKNFKRLEPFFGELQLSAIHVGHILNYRQQRQQVAGAGRINKEINTLLQILERAGLREEVEKWYEPLPLPKEDAGIALTEEEERCFFEVAQRRPKCKVAYYAELLSRNTCCGPGEIRHLRLGAIDLSHQTISITEGVKNGYRERVVPLSDVAYWSVLQLLDLAGKHGCTADHHYLLPARKRVPGNPSGYDPSTPQGSWWKAHKAIRLEVAKKFPRLKSVRIYDFRHTGATVMLENPLISYATIERIMGHRLGSRIKEKYSHIRDATLRQAINALESRKAPSAVKGQMYAITRNG